MGALPHLSRIERRQSPPPPAAAKLPPERAPRLQARERPFRSAAAAAAAAGAGACVCACLRGPADRSPAGQLVEEATADLRGDQEGAGAEEELAEEDGEEGREGVLFLLRGVPFSCGAAINFITLGGLSWDSWSSHFGILVIVIDWKNCQY